MGGDNNESIVTRIREKESKIYYLENELEKLQLMLLNKKEIENITSQIKALVRDFDKIMKHATPQEKKKIVSLFIEGIHVNRISEEATVYIRKLPTVNKKIDLPYLSVSSVAEEGFKPPTRGL